MDIDVSPYNIPINKTNALNVYFGIIFEMMFI